MSGTFEGLGGDVRRRVWMSALAIAVRPAESEKTVDRLIKILPLLASFSDEAFNDQTLRFAATASSGVPNAKTLIGVLDEWVRKNRPAPLALVSPEKWLADLRSKGPTRDEIIADWDNAAYIREKSWEISERIRWAERAGDDGFAGLFGQDDPPGGLPVHHDLERRLARMLTAAVGKFAPQHLGLLQPNWVDEWQRTKAE